MLVYYYDEETKGFLCSEEAHLDPLETKLKGEDVYLLPANATFKKPIEEKEGFKRLFDGERWLLEEIEVEEQPEPTEDELLKQKVSDLKFKLFETDYVVIKIAEGEATAEEYSEILAQRKAWRAEINQLEALGA